MNRRRYGQLIFAARQRREILDMVRRAYCDGDAEWKAERQAAEKAAKKAGGR